MSDKGCCCGGGYGDNREGWSVCIVTYATPRSPLAAGGQAGGHPPRQDHVRSPESSGRR